MKVDREALAWAAGFFDGEGSFIMSNKRAKGATKQYSYPKASIGQSFRPILERFHHAVLGIGTVKGPYRTYRSPFWAWSCNGFHEVQAVVALLWNWLDKPKRIQATEMLLCALQASTRFRRSKRQIRLGQQGGVSRA